MPQIHIPGVGLVEFPESMSGEDISAAAKRLHDNANPPEAPGSSSLLINLASKSAPAATRVAEEIATTPYLSQLGSSAGRLAGGTAGLKTGGYIGMEAGKSLGSAAGRGAAGLVQRGAGSVANVLARLAPYAQTLSTLSGATGAAELAQMAGHGGKQSGISIGDERSAAEKAAHPALINALLQRLLSLGQ